MHPAALVTVKEYVPAAKPNMVLLAPDPDIAPGLIVQLPAGKPVSITLPVADEQSGWVIAPSTGADGVAGWVLITTLADAGEIQPAVLVTV
jgi:hypothetical protein